MEVLVYVTKLVEGYILQTENSMMQLKNCLSLLWSQEHCKKIELFLFAYCCSGSVARSWPCEIKGGVPVYFSKVRISFSMLASHGPSAGSYMAQKCQRCFMWIMPLLHKQAKTALRSWKGFSSKPWQSVSANKLPSWKPTKPSRMCFLQRLSSLSKPC